MPGTLMTYTPGEGVWSPNGKRLLDWAPVVTRHLITAPGGKQARRMVTVIVGDESATVSMSDVVDGSIWNDRFTTTDGTDTRSVRDALASIVKNLAKQLEPTPTLTDWVDGRLVVPPADVLPAGYCATAGTSDEFAVFLKAVAEAPTIALVMGLAAGGLYYRPMRRDSGFMVHVSGPSSRGKSTALDSSACIFGDPEEVARRWNITPNGLYAWLRELSCLTGFRDEIGEAKIQTSKQLEEMVLAGTNGAAREMSSKEGQYRAAVGSWIGGLISTGNHSVVDRIANEAVAARVVEISAAVPLTKNAEQADKLSEMAHSCYGHGLTAIAERGPKVEDFADWIKNALAGLKAETQGVKGRVSKHIAAGVAGARMLGELFGVDELAPAALEAARYVQAELYIGLTERGETPGVRLLKAVGAAMVSNPGQFPTREKYKSGLGSDYSSPRDVGGWDLIEDDTYPGDVAVLPDRMAAIATAAGIQDLHIALKELRQSGQLLVPKPGRLEMQISVGPKGTKDRAPRCHVLQGVFADDEHEPETGDEQRSSEEVHHSGHHGSPPAGEPNTGSDQQVHQFTSFSVGKRAVDENTAEAPDATGADAATSGNPDPEELPFAEPGINETSPDQQGHHFSEPDSVSDAVATWLANVTAAVESGDSEFFASPLWVKTCADLDEGLRLGHLRPDDVARLRALHDARTREIAVIPGQRGSDLTEPVRSPKAASRTHPRSPRGSAAPSTTPADDALSAVGIDVVRGKLTASPTALPDGISTLPQLLEWAAGLNLGKIKPLPDNKRIRYDGLIYITAEAATALGLPDEAPGQKVNNKTNKLGAALRKAGWEWVESRGLTGYTSIYRGKGAAKASLRLCVLPWRQAEKEGNAPEFQELAGGDGPQAAALARRQNRIAAIGMPLLWTSAASGLELLGDHKPPRIHAKSDDGRWVTDDTGAYVWTQNPASVEATPVPMPLPLLHHAHPGAAGRAPEDTVVEEDFMWCRGGATPVLSAAEASQPWAVTVDTVTSFAAVLENLRVPLGTYTPGGPTQLENTSSEVRRLYGFAKADLRGLPIEDGLPHFAGEGYEPDGPGWYALNTIYYAMREYGHDGHVSETLITDRSGRLFDTWWPAIRDEYLRIMDSVGVPADLRGQAFLDAYATWKDRADEDTLAVQAALKMVYKGAIGKLGQGPSGDIDTWVANLAKQPWNRRDIRAYVLGEARTRTHRRYRLTRKYTGFSPFAVFRDCAVYALPEATPLPLMSPDEDPETGKPIRGALRLGIRPGDVKPEGVAPLAGLLDRCAQMVAENPAARPNPASIAAHWNDTDQTKE